MYTLSLEILNKCNMNCSYCYLGEKTNKIMDEWIAHQAIDIAIHEAKKQKDKSLLIYFIGGEPLLVFDYLCELVDYAELCAHENGLKVLFSTTTNATLLDDRIIEYIISKNFNLKISLDGNKEANDINRTFYNGDGSYEVITSKLHYIKKYESIIQRKVRVAQVIDPTNVSNYYNGFVNLHNLGFTCIETAANAYANWSMAEYIILKEQLFQTCEYYLGLLRRGTNLFWKLYLDSIYYFIYKNANFYQCRAGMRSVYVDVDGTIYPCQAHKDLSIGIVSTGLQPSIIRMFVATEDNENSKCSKCPIKESCAAYDYIMLN